MEKNMTSKTKSIFVAILLGASSLAATAGAQQRLARIGVLTDQSSLYQDISGAGSILAAEMAAEDSGLRSKGWTIEVRSADHQNKPDIGVNIARQWIDVDRVDVIADVNNSSVALAVNSMAREKNVVHLNSGAASADLTNAQCSPNTVHWTYDTYMLAHGTGTALTKSGGNTWFFLTADYAFGAALERDTTTAINVAGGKVVGSVRHPINTSDFSSFLLQAQASRAKVIGLANAGGDTVNAVKQASEFGIVAGGQNLAGLLLFISDIHALGLQTAKGLYLTSTFYWNLNDGTRAFSKRFHDRSKTHAMPTMVQAGVYSSLIHYLKTLDKLGENPHDGAKVVAAMKAIPVDDPLFGKGKIEPNGRNIHDAYLFEVKSPAESKGAWDYYKLVATIPGNEAFTPLDKSTCPLLKK
jgi:branched-chain amino acid transport system substrate-binding protein